VVLHELCHLRVPRHGEAFLPLFNQHMADWQDGTTAPGSPTPP
jgi:predicted metal-dependent hydrolase